MGRRNGGPRLKFIAKLRTFYICWTEGGRSFQRSTGTPDSREAQSAFEDWCAQRRREDLGPRDPSQALIAEVLNDYAREMAGKMARPERLGYALDPLLAFFGDLTLADLRPEICRAYERARDRAPGTVRRELGTLRAAINHAFNEGRITRPVPVRLPAASPPRDRWFTRHEVAALLNAARTSSRSRLHLPLFILIGLRCGKRKEAILSLRWSQVDFGAGVINWERESGPITKKRRGRNPIPDKLRPHLLRARRRAGPLSHVISYEGRPVQDVKTAFRTACRRAGLEDASPHTLRHTCATWALQGGQADLWEIAGFLGMTTETLQKTYGHHHPQHQRRAANAF